MNRSTGYWATMQMCLRRVFDGNLLQVARAYLLRFLQFFLFILIWRGLAAAGADLGGMTLEQLTCYSLLATLLNPLLDITTPATEALWEGSIVGRYLRPNSVLLCFAAETVGGRWLPALIFYSLPLALLSPLLGISLAPASWVHGLLAAASLCLSVLLGFALDLAFAALAVRMKNGCWAALDIRRAFFSLLSGAAIPFALFPEAVGRALGYLPFGAIASAPLTLYVGANAQPLQTLALQAVWTALFWLLARWAYHKSEERMISYGG
ncbi:MAG: hypothetical protein ACOYJA_00940 [Christensenellales bacterium]|jgi:ABC-2 type transport system permease protein